MAFLNPFLLFGAAAIGVPIIIHLLNKRKFDRVVWAAMRFLQVSVQKNQRRVQIEDLLLLLLRCLLITILVLALARPALKGASSSGLFGQAKVTAVVVLDNSYSMSQTDGVNSRFERAKSALEQTIDSLPAGSSVSVILASTIADAVIPEPTYDLNLARKTIREAKLCDRGTNLLRAVDDSIDILKKRGGLRREIYLATDGQAAGFAQLDEIDQSLDHVKSDIHAHVLLCGQAETRNLSVSALSLGSDIPASGALHSFDIEVTNWGKQEESQVRVTLAFDDQQPSAEAIIDKIGEGQSRIVSLAAKVREEGYHTITAALTADHLPADDTRTIAFRGVKRVNVLLVDGEPGDKPRDSEVFFLRHAMTPVPRAEAPDYLVQCTTIVPSDLTAQKLDDFQVIVLANVADFDDKSLGAMTQFVRSGGGVMVFPGGNTIARFYNERMSAAGFLPATLGDVRGDAADETHFVKLSSQLLEHPIVAVWKDPQSGDIGAAHFFRRYVLTPVDKIAAVPDSGPGKTILMFNDKTPYMVEHSLGQGRVALFASTAGTRWNDLPDHAGIFPPLMYRTVGWMVMQRDRRLNVNVGERFIFHLPVGDLNREATVKPPRAAGTVRDARRVEMDAAGLPTITYEDTGQSGGYQIDIPGEAAIRFAAQPDKSESSLEDISESQKQTLSQSATVVDWKPGMDMRAMLEKERVGTELWLPLAVIVLLIATSETFLADWFSRAK